MLKLLYFELIGIEERNEREFILVENGMIVDRIVQLCIFLAWSGIELRVEVPQFAA